MLWNHQSQCVIWDAAPLIWQSLCVRSFYYKATLSLNSEKMPHNILLLVKNQVCRDVQPWCTQNRVYLAWLSHSAQHPVACQTLSLVWLQKQRA